MNYCGIMLDTKKVAGIGNDRAHKQTFWHESEELLFHVSLNSIQMDQVLLGWRTEHVQGEKEVEPLIVQTDPFQHSCVLRVLFLTGKKTPQSLVNLI